MAISQTDTKDVMVTVNGPLSMLKNLKADDIKVSVNLSRAKEGRQIFTIRKGDVIVPAGLKVEDAKPGLRGGRTGQDCGKTPARCSKIG